MKFKIIIALLISSFLFGLTTISNAKTKKLEPFELKYEIYGDKDSFDMPRIQFVWRGPNRDHYEIWSVKVDGTDLRLTVDAELLYRTDNELYFHGIFVPSRSPDNRYILVNLVNDKTRKTEVHIIDLKDKTTKRLLKEGFIANYPWTSDSQSFFYRGGNYLKRFHLTTNKEETIKYSYNRHIYVQQDKEQLWEVFKDGVRLLDFEGNKIKEVNFNNIDIHVHYISPNGNYIYYFHKGKPYLSSINQPELKIKMSGSKNPLIDSNNNVFFSSSSKVKYFDFKKNAQKTIFSKYGEKDYSYETGSRMALFSLINERN